MEKENKDKIYKKWWFWILIVLALLIIIVVINKIKEERELNKTMENIGKAANDYINGIDNSKSHLDEFSYNYTTGKVDYQPNATNTVSATSTEPEIPTSTEPEPAQTTAPETASATMGQKNALSKAKDYLDYTSFSYKGLIEQLEYEGFSTEEATYGVDNCGADWNEQAVKKAKDYIGYTSFSKSGLIEQLEYEGFTKEQAEYAVSAVGY